ncbi:hypothetical protein ACLIYM_25485 [Streptomyces fenghuangensis]
MTTKATKKAPPTPVPGGEADLVHYTPEQVYEKRLLPYTPRTLRDMCQRHEIPHSRMKGPRGRIYFTLPQIREIAADLQVRPIRETKAARPVRAAA